MDLKDVFIINTVDHGLNLKAKKDGIYGHEDYQTKIKNSLRSYHGKNGMGSYGGMTAPALSLLRVVAKNETTSLVIYAPAYYSDYSDLEVQLVDNEVLQKQNIIKLDSLLSNETKKVSRYFIDDTDSTYDNDYNPNLGSKRKGLHINVLFMNDKLSIIQNKEYNSSIKNPYISAVGLDYEQNTEISLRKLLREEESYSLKNEQTVEELLGSIEALQQLLDDEYCAKIIKDNLPILVNESKKALQLKALHLDDIKEKIELNYQDTLKYIESSSLREHGQYQTPASIIHLIKQVGTNSYLEGNRKKRIDQAKLDRDKQYESHSKSLKELENENVQLEREVEEYKDLSINFINSLKNYKSNENKTNKERTM